MRRLQTGLPTVYYIRMVSVVSFLLYSFFQPAAAGVFAVDNSYSVVRSHEIRFECDSLYMHIADSLGIMPGLPVFEIDILDLTELHARSAGIESLEGLQYAGNLRVLDLRNNNIRDIQALESLVGLEWLSLRGNSEIRDISALSELYNLRYLNLNRNSRIESLQAIRNLHRLETLIVRDVPVMHLPREKVIIASLPRLQRLNIRNTGLETVSVLLPGLEDNLYREQLDVRNNSLDKPELLHQWEHIEID
ncbi:leucine-rich repeat domain-containing protein [Spirochaeta dissipatitropha]